MKEIWINLELYFKRYDFYNFSDFFCIFPDFSIFIFYLKPFLKKKKNFGLRVGPAWMQRGTQGHVAAPRGPMQRLCGAVNLYIYYIIYRKYK